MPFEIHSRAMFPFCSCWKQQKTFGILVFSRGIESKHSLHKKCPYSELFWSAFSCIRTKYAEILCIPPYAVRMQENADQNNSE